MAPILHADSCDCGGGGGSFACSDLDACSIDALADVDTSGASDGDVLTLDGTTWVPAAPAGGGGWKAFGESVVTGGNGDAPVAPGGAVTNLAPITLDAATGDLIECGMNSIFFGPQTFYSLSITSGTPRVLSPRGWYYTSQIGTQGGWSWAPFKFLVLATDLTAGQITVRLDGSGQGGAGTVLEGGQFQACNYGAPA